MASFKNFNRVSGYKDILKQKSSIRIQESPLFESIRVRKQWQEDNEIEFLDLNFQSRLKQKNKIEAFLLSNQNSLREKVNLPTYETYKEFMEREDDPDILDINSEILGEAANILIDLIELKNKPLLAISTTQDNDESYLIQYQ
jgi:hypothetical protein